MVSATSADDGAWINETLTSSWGLTMIVTRGHARDAAALPALVAESDRQKVGLLTYELSDHGWEIVSLRSPRPRTGIGTALDRLPGSPHPYREVSG